MTAAVETAGLTATLAGPGPLTVCRHRAHAEVRNLVTPRDLRRRPASLPS
jgi:hypothetical protein